MAAKSSRQYTIRSVPPDLDRALRARAKREKKSLNEVVLETLQSGLGMNQTAVYDDLDHCIGTWKEDPAFDAAILAQDQVEPGLWR